MKPAYFYSLIVAVFAGLFIAFGYLDQDLPDERRWFGAALIIAGMAIVLPAARRLREDWNRLKPLHSVDLAFLQMVSGVAVLVLASLLGGKVQKTFAPLVNPTPQLVRPADQASR